MRLPLRLRPRFEKVVPLPAADFLQRLDERLGAPGVPFEGSFYGRHVILRMPADRARYWSPQLSLDVEAHQEGTLLRGHFGPHPSVWTLFVAAYALLGFAGVTALAIGYSQWTLGMPAWGLWVALLTALLALVVYLVGLFGRKLGRPQMAELQAFLDDVLNFAGRIPEYG